MNRELSNTFSAGRKRLIGVGLKVLKGFSLRLILFLGLVAFRVRSEGIRAWNLEP